MTLAVEAVFSFGAGVGFGIASLIGVFSGGDSAWLYGTVGVLIGGAWGAACPRFMDDLVSFLSRMLPS